MSLSIKSSPGDYYSAHGDLIWVLYQPGILSDPVTYSDYKYIAYVYINGGASPVARLARTPQPDTKFGVFNIGDIIRSYVASVFNPAANTIVAQQTGVNEFFVNATVYFTEEYCGEETPATHTDGLSQGAQTYFNHYNGRHIGNSTRTAMRKAVLQPAK